MTKIYRNYDRENDKSMFRINKEPLDFAIQAVLGKINRFLSNFYIY
ncbi:MAG: hypothetical protein IKO19_10705 [Candidatus Riflebacteria bacterium]|nr:hypothetical protein [Candidatus Riflebacteria bacterium]